MIITKLGEYPGYELPNNEKKQRLYHYTSFESFLKIWETKSLLFCPAVKTNDIIERNRMISGYSKKDLLETQKILNQYKQISLTMDYDTYTLGCMSNMMWGHYGDRGQGVCIELNRQKLDLQNMFHKPIIYKKELTSPPSIPLNLQPNDINYFILKNIDSFFFEKSIDWSGENEYRIISNEFDKLDITNAITSITVADAFSPNCEVIEKLVSPISVNYFGSADFSGW